MPSRGVIEQLADEDFTTREKAEEELVPFGQKGLAQLGAAARDASLERQRRAIRVLTRLEPNIRTALLRAGRVVAALERAGTPEAQRLLEEWARDGTDSHLVAEAKAALERLSQTFGRGQ